MTATFLTAGQSSALMARTRAIEPPADVLDELAPDGFAWFEDGAGLVTSGVAARIPAADAGVILAEIEVDDPISQPGTGAVAVGALPFDAGAAGELVIPARVVGLTDGRAWRTEIGPPRGGRTSSPAVATRFAVESGVPRSLWRSQVRTLLDAIAAGTLAKAVLARDVVVTADAPFDVRGVIDRLRRTQGGCFVFAADGLVGATPELLARRRGGTIVSRPMAGTVARGATGQADAAAEAALAASAKDGLEHRLVVDAVVAGLRAGGVEVTSVTDPQVARLATMSHLATTITARVEQSSPSPSALELACGLHPTPAVGGAPRDAALATLRRLETFERGRYAGPVGWVDGRGDGSWGVALRCAEIEGASARLIAGAGIVAGSDPDAEWAETQAKFEPMLQVLVRP
jgi:menaquinone-specific isochorismate synthase